MNLYDKLAKEYHETRKDKNKFDFNRDLEVPAMIKMIGNVKGKKILDVGCGFADHLQELSKKKPSSMAGFDISPAMVKLAKNLKIPNCTLAVQDMKKPLNYRDEEFDIVFSSLAIHYISKKELNKLFKEVSRVLKKKRGEFIFSTGHPIFNLRKRTISDLLETGDWRDGMPIKLDYFNESLRHDGMQMNIYNFTTESLIKTALKNGFEITDYTDVRPTPSSRRFDKYQLLNKTPTFIIFKLKKR